MDTVLKYTIQPIEALPIRHDWQMLVLAAYAVVVAWLTLIVYFVAFRMVLLLTDSTMYKIVFALLLTAFFSNILSKVACRFLTYG